MLRAVLMPMAALAVVAVLWVNQCSGPQPHVVGAARLEEPAQRGDPYRVGVTIRNDGKGHGEVRVTARLVDKGSGQDYQRDEPVQLDNGETARVVVEVPAPPGDYDPQVEVKYPPG